MRVGGDAHLRLQSNKKHFSGVRPAAANARRAFTLSEELLMDSELDFEKMNGLLPAVVQDWRDGEVLMVGFMNRQALEQTLRNGYVTFFSRTRNQLWMKGESSGNRLRVRSAQTDCDRDTLLVRVEVEGAGVVCHRGTRSCFTEPVPVPSERVAEEAR
jgi:phosphoribosyl-ATP pyrophosphohydrolase/phosphoribosyl-AMP cyclohydrolase